MSVSRAFRIAYDGRPFYGYQRQPDVRTVEGDLFGAFGALGLGEPTAYAAAGRTDAGVSAIAQTISCRCPPWLSPAALNGVLPASIRVWAMADVPTDFHARYDAHSRTYRYFLYGPDLDMEVARLVASAVEGSHDFVNLCVGSTDTTRTITEVAVTAEDPWLVLTVTAPGFLRQQVRRIASLVELMAAGERQIDELDRLLMGPQLPGGDAIPPAPAEPLVLLDVDYGPEIGPFQPDANSPADEFGRRARELHTTARVLSELDAQVGGDRHAYEAGWVSECMSENSTVSVDVDGEAETIELPSQVLAVLAEEGESPADALVDLLVASCTQQLHGLVYHVEDDPDPELEAAEAAMREQFEARFGMSFGEATGHAH